MTNNMSFSQKDLDDAAAWQKKAAEHCGDAAGTTSGITTSVWVSHGVISGVSNWGFAGAADAHASAGRNLSAACNRMAAYLGTAGVMYKGVDSDLAVNLDKQVLDR